MDWEPTYIKFNIGITVEQFRYIIDKDNDFENEDEWDKTLYKILEKIDGVTEVDYNGHFGAYIFVTLEWDKFVKAKKEVTLAIKEYCYPKFRGV